MLSHHGGVPLASEAEQAQLVELRDLVRADMETHLTEKQRGYEELTGDIRLLRFLRGYKHVVGDAADAYRKMLAWYQADHMGAIRDDIVDNHLTLATLPHSPLVMQYYFANVWHGEDAHGNVFNIEMTGQIEPRNLNRNLPEETFLTWHRYHLELKSIYSDRESRKRQRLVRTFAIKDLRGLGLKHAHQPTLNLLRKAIKIGTDNYPEMLDKLLIINAPTVFNMLWKIVKPMINQHTLEKIQIFGSSGYHDIIRQKMEPKSVPMFLGGLCTCEGGCIKNWAGSAVNADGMQEVEIHRGQKYDMLMNVTAGTEVKWAFTVKAHDIRFLVEFKPDGDDSETETIVDEQADSTTEHHGSFRAPSMGELTLCWDNGSAFFRSKHVAFKFDIVTDEASPVTVHGGSASTTVLSESGSEAADR